MKLRNKKTGEIGRLLPYGGEDGKIWVWIDNMSRPEYRYNSLAEVNADWEDYEEPKRFYWLDYNGDIYNTEIGTMDRSEIKEIGNLFETKEEAELALRKLKAWKRLKDKGFRFETLGFDRERVINGRCNLIIKATFNEEYSNDIFNLADLDLLFSGEDD